ncbi:MAG: Hint domain-containing protein [Rhodobacteraceae bacterium]|nr:Hint domain-containing protein [Paracoccaceae bacterium]
MPVCFVAGTLIATPAGAVPVEGLRPGDLVETWDQGAQPVRWVTSTTRSLADLVTNRNPAPCASGRCAGHSKLSAVAVFPICPA